MLRRKRPAIIEGHLIKPDLNMASSNPAELDNSEPATGQPQIWSTTNEGNHVPGSLSDSLIPAPNRAFSITKLRHIHQSVARHDRRLTNIVVVHPFYFRDDDELSAKQIVNCERLLIKIEATLRELDRDRFRIALVDNDHSFLQWSNSWTTAGLVDRVFLGRAGYRAEYALNPRDRDFFREVKTNYILGLYGGRCVAGVAHRIAAMCATTSEIPAFWKVRPVTDGIGYKDRSAALLAKLNPYNSLTGKRLESLGD